MLPGFSLPFGLAATSVPYSETSATPAGASFGANFTMFDRSWAADNNATITSIGFFNNVGAGNVTVKIALRNSSTSYTVVVNETFAHAAGGWQDFTLSSPYVVPASGTYHVGVYQNIGTLNSNGSTARTFKNADVTGTDTGMSEDTGNAPALRVTGTKPS